LQRKRQEWPRITGKMSNIISPQVHEN
jgi:hypothetical protein